MKKLLYFSFLFIIGFTLLSCDNKSNNNAHTSHTYGPWEVLREKTCTQEGEEIRYCECGESETRTTGYSSHSYILDFQNEPSCYEQGVKRYSCEYCGNWYEENYGEPQHNYVLAYETTPQCGTNGVKHYECSHCGDWYDESIPSPECTFVEGERIEPTCTSDGYIIYVCTTNPSHTYQETIPATGEHSLIYDYSEDWHTIQCESCAEYYIGGLPHTFTEKVVGDGTCINSAEIIKECVCGYKYTVGYVYEHNYVDDICTLCNEHRPSEGLIYTLTGDNYIVSSLGTCTDTHVYIPRMYLGKEVIGIASNAFKNGSFTDITIPNSIKYFGTYSFANCSNLENVYYNGTLNDWMNVSIAESTGVNNTSTPMYYAEKIYFKENNEYVYPTTITIPEDITEIKKFTFAYFKQVTKYVFSGNAKKIGIGAFTGATGFTSITLTGVEEIGNAAFYNATNLTTISFDNTLREIGASAFYYCTSLDNVVIPEGTKTIYDGAFNCCTSLKNISIPNSVEAFGQYMFTKCDELEYYEIDGNLYLGNPNNQKLILVSLVSDELTQYVVDENTKILLSSAFAYAPNITDLTIHENVIFMGINILRSLTSLERLEMPFISSTTYTSNTLSDYAYNLDNLKYLKITKCSRISSNSLELAYNVEELILPNNVKQIGSNILSGFNNLKSLTIPYISYEYDADPSDLSYLFGTSQPESLKNLHITNALYISGYLLNQCANFEALTLPNNLLNISYFSYDNSVIPFNEYENGRYIGSVDNPYLVFLSLADTDATVLELHPDTKVIYTSLLNTYSNLEYTFYKNVKYIGDNDNLFEFAYGKVDESITDIEFHDDTKVIYEGAISSVNNVTLPKGIEQIYIYNNGQKISSLYYKGTLMDWMNLVFHKYSDNPLFYANDFYYTENNDYVLLDELVIPDTVTSINDYQFYSSNISKLYIHENVTYIGKAAFSNCTNLREVTILGSIDTLANDVFNQCSGIQTLKLSNNIKNIKDGAFANTSINQIYYEGDLNDWLEISFASSSSTPVASNSNVLFKTNDAYESVRSINITGDIEIGDYQFYNFKDLEEITIEYGITSIGYYAFAGTRIYKVYVPDSVTYIGAGSFKTTQLAEVDLPFLGKRIDDSENANIYHLFDITPTTSTDIYMNITKATIRGGYVGKYAFYNCRNLIKLSIPDVTSIGDYAFNYCYYVEEFTLPKSLTSIGEYAFSNCNAFNNITLPKTLRYVGINAFENDWFENIYFEDTITKWFDITFCSDRANPKFSANNIYFLTNGNYEKVNSKLVIDSSITQIGSHQLVNFDDITELYIHENVTYIGNNFLYGCDNINKITTPFIGPSIDNISSNSSIHYFYDIMMNNLEECSSITELVITKAITIGDDNGYGFIGLTNLKKITLPSTLERCSENPYFINNVIEEVHYNGTLEQYLNISFSTHRENVEIGHYMKLYLLDEFNSEYLVTDVVIPDTINIINPTIFAGYELNNVTIHSNVTEISGLSFYNSKINNVYYNGDDNTWFNIKLEYYKSSPALYANTIYFNYDGSYKPVTSAVISEEIYYIKGQLAGFKELETLTVGQNVNSFEHAFVGCESLNTIYFNKQFDNYLAMGIIGDIPQHKLYLSDDNDNYYQVTDITINTSVTSHFSSIIGLKTIIINEPNENNAIVLYSNAFSNNLDLESITINGTIHHIEAGALKNNPKLEYTEYENGKYLGSTDNPYQVLCGKINEELDVVPHPDCIIVLE